MRCALPPGTIHGETLRLRPHPGVRVEISGSPDPSNATTMSGFCLFVAAASGLLPPWLAADALPAPPSSASTRMQSLRFGGEPAENAGLLTMPARGALLDMP